MVIDLDTHDAGIGSNSFVQPAIVASSVFNESTVPADNEPVPVYSLPVRTFAVQPPPKLTAGTATSQPLDKTTAKVRRWRVAQREIRGIAGGRWFVQSWIGDKESAYSTAAIAMKNTPTPSGAAPKQKKFKFVKPDLPPARSEASTPVPSVPAPAAPDN
jgi:hypothetical protein